MSTYAVVRFSKTTCHGENSHIKSYTVLSAHGLTPSIFAPLSLGFSFVVPHTDTRTRPQAHLIYLALVSQQHFELCLATMPLLFDN